MFRPSVSPSGAMVLDHFFRRTLVSCEMLKPGFR